MLILSSRNLSVDNWCSW